MYLLLFLLLDLFDFFERLPSLFELERLLFFVSLEICVEDTSLFRAGDDDLELELDLDLELLSLSLSDESELDECRLFFFDLDLDFLDFSPILWNRMNF